MPDTETETTTEEVAASLATEPKVLNLRLIGSAARVRTALAQSQATDIYSTQALNLATELVDVKAENADPKLGFLVEVTISSSRIEVQVDTIKVALPDGFESLEEYELFQKSQEG